MYQDKLRHCIFRPYAKGQGPSFDLRMWDTGKTDERGGSILGYTLSIRAHKGAKAILLFTGTDYHPSPCVAIDSDESVAGLMTFLTLRPGDTDSEHFEGYTPGQLAYCENHAETLSCEVMARYGEV